jgi:hypothetical protein
VSREHALVISDVDFADWSTEGANGDQFVSTVLRRPLNRSERNK